VERAAISAGVPAVGGVTGVGVGVAVGVDAGVVVAGAEVAVGREGPAPQPVSTSAPPRARNSRLRIR
jgi:hypothetical protein